LDLPCASMCMFVFSDRCFSLRRSNPRQLCTCAPGSASLPYERSKLKRVRSVAQPASTQECKRHAHSAALGTPACSCCVPAGPLPSPPGRTMVYGRPDCLSCCSPANLLSIRDQRTLFSSTRTGWNLPQSSARKQPRSAVSLVSNEQNAMQLLRRCAFPPAACHHSTAQHSKAARLDTCWLQGVSAGAAASASQSKNSDASEVWGILPQPRTEQQLLCTRVQLA
jgi:hypothetical protein